jgi:hypothetical protein
MANFEEDHFFKLERMLAAKGRSCLSSPGPKKKAKIKKSPPPPLIDDTDWSVGEDVASGSSDLDTHDQQQESRVGRDLKHDATEDHDFTLP